MSIAQSLLPEYDQEMAGVRKTLERIPDDKFAWKPHEKSMTLGRLSVHLAEIPDWTKSTLEADSLDFAPVGAPPYTPPDIKNRAEVLAMFDENVASGRVALSGASDEEFEKNWSLLMGGQTLFTMPKLAVIRTWVLNHSIHHRAQLGVYLRLNDIAVPAIYGPSADEQGM